MARWKATLPATAEAGSALRGEIAAIARDCGLSDERVGDVELAVAEAVSNVVRHAYDGQEPGQMVASADVDEGTLRIVIADRGRGLLPRSDSPGLGLGLPLMAQLADTMDVISNDPGTEIHMTFPCPSSRAP